MKVNSVVMAVIFAILFSACGAEIEDKIRSNTYATQGYGHNWTHGDWTSRVLWEARYALSQSANGYSSNQASSDQYGQRWYGDWDYVASDTYARDKAKWEGYGVQGLLGSDGSGHYRSGWCTYFARLILYRSTYWAQWYWPWIDDHYTTPNYPNSVYSDPIYKTYNYNEVQPGWVLITPSNTHYAIAEQRAYVNGSWGWWVIDSNWVCSYCIGKHFLPDYKLENDGYYGWKPDRATNN